MKTAKTITQVREILKEVRKANKTVGLVPTMGYLHKGHASLIKKAVKENDFVVLSDFVNPIQFGPEEDFEAYPRDFEKDKELCEKLGVNLIFNPNAEDMYQDRCAFVDIEKLSSTLCGSKRKGHFRGVCTVVLKLFNIVQPDRAYFGQKDAQQLAIIRKMVKDLSIPVEIVPCEIIREEDGLAISSRNTYLNDEERKAALCLSRAVKKGKQIISKSMKSEDLIEDMKKIIEDEKLAKIDYLEIVDLNDMQKVEKIDKSVLVALAVYIGKTRLIDNFIYEV